MAGRRQRFRDSPPAMRRTWSDLVTTERSMSDTSAAAAPIPNAAPYMWCSDCRAQMRDRYYALNERPICATCRPGYAEKIERRDGKEAMWRIGVRGVARSVGPPVVKRPAAGQPPSASLSGSHPCYAATVLETGQAERSLPATINPRRSRSGSAGTSAVHARNPPLPAPSRPR